LEGKCKQKIKVFMENEGAAIAVVQLSNLLDEGTACTLLDGLSRAHEIAAGLSAMLSPNPHLLENLA
jgi:hypothetical protein